MEVEDYIRLIQATGMSVYQYTLTFALPAMAAGLFMPILLLILLPDLFSGYVVYMLALIPALAVILVFIYPILNAEQIKNSIEDNIHFFVTHIGILATSEAPAPELFRSLSTRTEYGYLAKTCGQIYMRFAIWHVSLADSCRIESKITPSMILTDFLDRFANALDAGENVETFLAEEQDYVMNEFAIRYRGSLYDIDVLKEVYLSIVITLVFLISFAIILPYLTGMDPGWLMFLVVILFFAAQLAIMYYIKSILPAEKIWYENFSNKAMRAELLPGFLLSAVGSVFVSLVIGLFFRWLPLEVTVALIVTPLVAVGYIARNIEEKIKRRDQFYVEFINSLGLGASARGGIIIDALKSLTYHDFGELTIGIRALHERLRTHISDSQSWFLFRVDCGSFLINKFTEMFIETLKSGGNPSKTSEIISRNFMRLQMLRRERYHSTASFIGIVYGIQGAIAFCIYISYGIVVYMNQIYSALEVPEAIVSSIITIPSQSSMELVAVMLVLVIVINALLCAMTIRFIDGGHMLNSLIHFVALTWVGAIVAVVSKMTLTMMLPMPTF